MPDAEGEGLDDEKRMCWVETRRDCCALFRAAKRRVRGVSGAETEVEDIGLERKS